MWHRGMNFGEIVNYKLFAEDLMRLLIAFIGSVLIIPVTSYISSRMLISKKSKSFVENVKKKIASAFEE
jgi:uncharacterized membrane protein